MKKVVISLSLIVSIILLTGCSAKDAKLVCTQTASGVDVTFNVGFKGNKIDTMDLSYDMDLSSYSDNQIKLVEKQDFCKRVKTFMYTYKDAFTNCTQSIENKKLNVKSDLDINKITKSNLEKISSPKIAQKQLEASGYKCTIE